MKKIKRRLVCLLLCVCLCSSLFVYANAVEPLDGPINADDEATLIMPTLEVSDVPQNTVAVGYNIEDKDISYYQMVGNIVLLNPDVTTFTEQGWIPDDDYGASLNHIIDNDGDGNPEDNRGIIVAPTTNPYRTIAIVETYYPGYSTPFYGTATMISPDVALTAAHCLYDQKYGRWPSRVVVTPAIVGTNYVNEAFRTKPFGSSDAQEVVISTLFYENLNFEDMNLNSKFGANYHDWGLIRLEEPIGNQSGYLGFQYKTENMQTDVGDPQCTIVGYPGDLNGYNEETHLYSTFIQYSATGDIERDTRGDLETNGVTDLEWRLFEHNIDATDGQSGSAVLFPDATETRGYLIVGIFTGGALRETAPDVYEELNYNYAIGITSQLYSFMVAYKSS